MFLEWDEFQGEIENRDEVYSTYSESRLEDLNAENRPF